MAPYAKALIAFFAPTVATLLGNLEEAIRTSAHLNWKLQAAVGVLSFWTALTVWAIPNTPKVNPVAVAEVAPAPTA